MWGTKHLLMTLPMQIKARKKLEVLGRKRTISIRRVSETAPTSSRQRIARDIRAEAIFLVLFLLLTVR